MSENKPGSKWDWLGPLVCLGVGLLPVACLLIATLVASLLGCRFDASGTDPCIRAGIPFGSVLYPLGAAVFLGILTVPLGVIAALIWTAKSVWKKIFNKD